MIKSNNKSAERTILSYYQTIENVEALHREMRMLKSEKGNKTRTFRLFDEEGNQVKNKRRRIRMIKKNRKRKKISRKEEG